MRVHRRGRSLASGNSKTQEGFSSASSGLAPVIADGPATLVSPFKFADGDANLTSDRWGGPTRTGTPG